MDGWNDGYTVFATVFLISYDLKTICLIVLLEIELFDYISSLWFPAQITEIKVIFPSLEGPSVLKHLHAVLNLCQHDYIKKTPHSPENQDFKGESGCYTMGY